MSGDGCADETVRADSAAGCQCTAPTNCATRTNAAPKTAIERLRRERVELLQEIAIQTRGAARVPQSPCIRVCAVNEIESATVKLRSQAREQDGGRAALVHHQLEVYRLSGLDLHALRLITRAEQSVRSLWYVELDKARAISSSRSYDAPIGRIQNRHLMPT